MTLETTFEDGSSEEKWECELQDFDAFNVGKRFVELEGLEEDELNQVRSGYNTLFVNGGLLTNEKLIIPEGAERSIGTIEPRGPVQRQRQRKKNKRARPSSQSRFLAPANVIERVVLAVRIIASDSATTLSVDTIADKIFGLAGDQINLVERYRSCSYGELLMKPYVGTTVTGKTIQNGVYELTIPINVLGAVNTDVRNQVEAALTQQLGQLTSQFDHVMLCLPPGTQSGWIAFSELCFSRSYISIYGSISNMIPSSFSCQPISEDTLPCITMNGKVSIIAGFVS